jgi:hypothetical protein
VAQKAFALEYPEKKDEKQNSIFVLGSQYTDLEVEETAGYFDFTHGALTMLK